MSEKKIRSGKISKLQKAKLLEVMKANKKVAMGTFSGPNSASITRSVWESVAVELNAAGGACKTAEQWKKSWSDWKCAIKKQEAANKKFQNRTGNLPASEGPGPLEGIEIEVLQFVPSTMIVGDGRTKEAGFTEILNFKGSNIETAMVNHEPSSETPMATSISKLSNEGTEATAISKPMTETTKATPPRVKNTFSSAYAEIKQNMREQEVKQTEFNNTKQEIVNTLRLMNGTLKSIDASLKTNFLTE